MAAQALYRRWRPQSFDDVVGQDPIVRTLRNAVDTDRMAHAYLFSGLRGTGKTSVARILAKAVNCVGDGPRPCNDCTVCAAITAGRSLDLIEIDAASNTGVDDVRELREKIGFAPSESRFKVYIVDEVHMLSTAAFNALLKTLEEPPEHALFILATTEPHKIPDTILSRCQRHEFRRVSVADVTGKLLQICEAEDVTAEKAALQRIARAGTGSLRDAESLLDQVVATGEDVTLERVRDILGVPGREAVVALVDDVVGGDAGAALRRVSEAMDRGTDPAQLQTRLLEHLRQILLVQTGVDEVLLDVPADHVAHLRRQAEAWPTPQLVAAIHHVSDARPSPDRTQPSLPLELALVESILDALESQGDAPSLGRGTSQARTAASAARDAAPEDSSADRSSPKASPASPDPQPKARPAASDDTAAAPTAQAPKAVAAAGNAPGAADPAPADTAGGGGGMAAGDAAGDATGKTASAMKDDTKGDAKGVATGEPAGSREGDAAGGSTDAPAPATPSGDAPQRDGLRVLRQGWERVIAGVASRDRNAAALLKDCRPVSVEGQDVVLGFFYEFHCTRAGEQARRQAIAEAIGEVLGQAPDLRLTVVPASTEDRQSRPRSKSERAGGDPVVRHAVDELGARIAGVRADPEDEGEGKGEG